MRSPRGLVGDDDLHTRARIRNAAIRTFAMQGFGVGLRAIAAEAGVSAASIVKHFGSKAGLREACDEVVLRVIREGKRSTVGAGDPATILRELAASEKYEDIALYVVTSLSEGGELARTLFEHMVDDAVDYLEAGVAAGVIRPSRDARARARYLTQAGLGALLVQLRLEPGGRPDMPGLMERLERDTMLPALELYTDGLFTDSRILDALLDGQHVPHDVAPDPPGSATA